MSYLSFVLRSFTGLFKVRDKVAGNLSNLPGICTEHHSLDGPTITIKSAKGRVGVQLYHSGHGSVGDQYARFNLLEPQDRQNAE